MKKKLRIALVILMCISMLIPNLGFTRSTNMNDIANHWAKTQINEWLEKKLAAGYPDGSFRPNDFVSRAQFFALVNRVFNYTETIEIGFEDVRTEDWFYNDIKKAARARYIAGFGENSISPKQNTARQEAAVVLSRVLGLEESTGLDLNSMFKDAGSISGQYISEVKAIINSGLMKGTPEGMFEPQKPITRAEAIVVLDRAAKFPGKPLKVDKPGTYSFGSAEGNIVITSGGVTLKDTVIKRNLIIDTMNGEGSIVLENVKVLGKVIIKSNREISIEAVNCVLNEVVVEKDSKRIKLIAKGSTEIRSTVLNSAVTLEENSSATIGFVNVIVEEPTPVGTEMFLSGSFDEILVKAKGIKIYLLRGIINSLNVTKGAKGNIINLSQGTRIKLLLLEAETDVYGKGIIEKAVIKSNGVNIEQQPYVVQLGKGITANIGFGVNTSSSKKKNSSSNDNNDDDEDGNKPIVREGLEFILEIDTDRDGKTISPQVLAQYGKTVTEAVYAEDGFIELEVLGNDGLLIIPVNVGDTDVTAIISNEYGAAEVTFNVKIVNVKSDEDIIKEAKDKIVLVVDDPAGKQSKPIINLPSGDDLGYDVNIEWIIDDKDKEFIAINESTAEVKRRGDSNEGGCGGHEELALMYSERSIGMYSCDEDEGGDDGGCGGDDSGSSNKGGKKNIAYLVAVISKGGINDSKEFKVTIPWGWGKPVIVTEKIDSEDDGSGGHDDGGCGEEELEAIDDLNFNLWLHQFPLVLSAADLATGGKVITSVQIQDEKETVVEAVYEDEKPVVDCKIAKDGRLWITPIGVGEAEIHAWVSNAKVEGGCGEGVVIANKQSGSSSEKSSEVEVEVLIKVIEPESVSDEDAVTLAVDDLELLLVSSGNGPKQTNKVNLPNTDYLGYQTKITWNAENSKYISIEEGKRAIIYRRGKDNGDGGCSKHSIELARMLAVGEVEIFCGDDGGEDEGGCGGGGSVKGGKMNIVTLTANITRGGKIVDKSFKVYIPWGWGRKIIIESEEI